MSSDPSKPRPTSSPPRPGRPRSPLARVLDAVGSVWFGVTMMVAILVYAWIGSAGLPVWTEERFWFVRQSFEKTEMEWFAWWPFNILLGLLAVALVLVTVRRIKLNLPNLGVWAVHVGILVLMAGCVLYFGRKIEGDVAVYRRQAVLTVPGGSASLVLRPGARAVLRGDDRAYDVSVASLQPEYELLTGDDAGKTTYAAQLMFRPLAAHGAPGDGPGRTPFVRQLLVGYPDYTEDVLPGRGRAVKAIGRPLVDEAVVARLEYAPSDTIQLRDSMALFARVSGEEQWSEMPLRGMPRYHEYAAPAGDVRSMTGDAAGPYPAMSLAKPWKTDPGGIDGDLSMRITGFLPFAHLVDAWAPGGERFNPYARVTVRIGGAGSSHELLAMVPGRSRAVIAQRALNASFKWVETGEELQRWLSPKEPAVAIRVPARGIDASYPLAAVMDGEIAIEGTGYTVRGLELYPDWTLARSGERASMALMQVDGPRGSFRRAVVWPRTELSQDLDGGGERHAGLLDNDIEIELLDLPESGLIVIGGEQGLHVLLANQGGGVMHETASPGQAVTFLDGRLEVVVDEVSRTARRVVRPVVIPKRERDLKAGAFYAAARVEVSDGEWSESMWLRYSHYWHPNVLGFHPMSLQLPDGRQLELLLSRERYPLPSPVVLEAFQLEVYPGRQRERDYISLVRFVEDGEPSSLHEVRSNQPTEHEAWWFFQATWDPPRPNVGHAGMNYTGLGVGNRHGVLVMLFGSALTVLGTLWAFYVKPVLLRRVRERARGRAAGRAPAGRPTDPSPAVARARIAEAEEGA